MLKLNSSKWRHWQHFLLMYVLDSDLEKFTGVHCLLQVNSCNILANKTL